MHVLEYVLDTAQRLCVLGQMTIHGFDVTHDEAQHDLLLPYQFLT